MTNSKTLADAIAKFAPDHLGSQLPRPRLSNSAITRRRHQAVMQARSEQLKALPPQRKPESEPCDGARGRAPKSAIRSHDPAGVLHRWSVCSRRDSRSSKIILNASPTRLDAIWLTPRSSLRHCARPTRPRFVETVRDMCFDRLVATGDPKRRDGAGCAAGPRPSARVA